MCFSVLGCMRCGGKYLFLLICMDDLDVQGINSTCICRSMSASSQTSLYPTVFCSVGNIYLLTSLGILSEKAMAPHSSTLAWKIPWMEEPGRLQSMGPRRVGHDRATSLSSIGEGNGNPLQCSCLENPRDEGAWWAAVYGVAQSRTRLKRLSSSSSDSFPRIIIMFTMFHR